VQRRHVFHIDVWDPTSDRGPKGSWITKKETVAVETAVHYYGRLFEDLLASHHTSGPLQPPVVNYTGVRIEMDFRPDGDRGVHHHLVLAEVFFPAEAQFS
jgi:hypothetical protein